ncbi:hypothetical protein BS78_10G065300 [Paspalum vaginatum]|nr:hypothetical protein BS78_10G065300 [Paspalum vaginatum]
MGATFRHVAGNMQHLLQANRTAVAIAIAAAMGEPTSDGPSASIDQVLLLPLPCRHYCIPFQFQIYILCLFWDITNVLGCLNGQVLRPKMFMAFAVQPLLAQVSYAGVDGAAFSYYRTGRGEGRALFKDSNEGWLTQAVDPATGRLVGRPAAAATAGSLLHEVPNATRALLAGKRAALGEGWARPGVRMIFFSAPVGDAGVVSAAVALDDVFGAAAASRVVGVQEGLDVYYAVGEEGAALATDSYKPLLLGERAYNTAEDTAERMLAFSEVKCAASTIDAPNLGQLVSGGQHRFDKYRVACTNFSVSGVQLVFRLVLRNRGEGAMLWAECIPVVVFVCALLAMAAVSCVLTTRALRRSKAREAALNADLVRQKEALRQAERKSMNKSNAFVSASHDIRSALAAIAGLVEMSRPEAHALPSISENLDQMSICTNKLFDILNSILDTSKVESGKMQLEEAEFSMADILQESVDMANVTGVRRGVEVIWDPCDFSVLRCATVIGDCKRLKQILDNLLGNALKFTEEGHVVLRAWANRPITGTGVSAPSRFPCPRLGTSAGSLQCLFGVQEDADGQNQPRDDPSLVEFYIEVVDTGIGIPQEKKLSVFENYVQVHDGHGGTGLGLGIVQSFVRLMGGEINIKDKDPGERGACFAFNVLLKMSERQEPQDIEGGVPDPLDAVNSSNARALVFQEASSYIFKGAHHCVLYIHGFETRRILQTWMESMGVKVWLVPQAELIASTLEKVQNNGTAATTAGSSLSSHAADGGDGGDRCFSSKEMVSQVLPMALRNSTGPRRGSHGGAPSGILVVVDVSGVGSSEEIYQEMVNLFRIKHLQAPCKVVLLEDIKTPSDYVRRLRDLGCNLVLRKPVHGARLFTLLRTLRDLQVSDAQAQSSHAAGLEIAENNTDQQDLPEIVVESAQETCAPTDAACVTKEQKPEDDKPLAGLQILLAEDTFVLQTIQRKMLTQLGASVKVAQDGAVAVNLFKEALEQASALGEGIKIPLPYDVIFMDCQMPNIDGYEATKIIREEERRHGIHTPIIALTAHEMQEDLEKAIHAGMDLHVTKPIEQKRIVEAVRSVCKHEN